MKAPTLALCALVLALPACESWNHRKGVGFTGIDGEPTSLPVPGGTVTRGRSVPEALAGLPPARVKVERVRSQADLASAAIASGGRTTANAVPVGTSEQTLMLSTVEANGTLFAVLRMPEGDGGRMATGAQDRFVASVPRLTGCLAGATAYASGGTTRPRGLAVPMNCR